MSIAFPLSKIAGLKGNTLTTTVLKRHGVQYCYTPLPPFFKDSELINELHNTVSETDIGVYTEHKITFDCQISITVSKIIQVMLSFNESYFI